jgi:predicted alternative tryptophan synthase beta-subunit
MATAQSPKVIPKGSVQYWPVEVFDAFSTISTLTGLDVRYDLYKVGDDEDTIITTNAAAGNSGMIALPLIDSTNLDEGVYKLFISFVASPQTPRLGPFYFKVDD